MNRTNRIHPAVLDAASALHKGKVNRRDFLRFATLLGTSATFAYAMAGCAPPPSAPAGGAAAPAAGATGAIKRGGAWTSGLKLQKICNHRNNILL